MEYGFLSFGHPTQRPLAVAYINVLMANRNTSAQSFLDARKNGLQLIQIPLLNGTPGPINQPGFMNAWDKFRRGPAQNLLLLQSVHKERLARNGQLKV